MKFNELYNRILNESEKKETFRIQDNNQSVNNLINQLKTAGYNVQPTGNDGFTVYYENSNDIERVKQIVGKSVVHLSESD